MSLKSFTASCCSSSGRGSNFESIFRDALTSDDPQEAERAAHTLKGVAANTRAKGIQAAAQDLETACKQGVEEKSALLKSVLPELEMVIT